MEFIDLKRQYQVHREILDQALGQVAASARYINGPQVAELEEKLAQYVGVREAVGVGSGTDALLVALLALGLRPGDEVICPDFTFIGAAEAVVLLGGRPVLADVEGGAGTLDPEAVEPLIGPRTVGLVPVDLYGQCARLEELEELAQRHGLWLLEDAAQSFGARRGPRMAGGFGQAAITSFYPAKPLGCMGDGGMVFTNDRQLAEKMRAIRIHGDGGRYNHYLLGLNARLDTLQAAVLLAKMTFFDEELELREKVAGFYQRSLEGLPGIETPVLLPGNTSVWAQYTVQARDRDGLAAHLRAQGVPTAIHYPRALHQQPVLREMELRTGRTENSTRLAGSVLSLPMHPYLNQEDQERVVGAIGSFSAA